MDSSGCYDNLTASILCVYVFVCEYGPTSELITFVGFMLHCRVMQ